MQKKKKKTGRIDIDLEAKVENIRVELSAGKIYCNTFRKRWKSRDERDCDWPKEQKLRSDWT